MTLILIAEMKPWKLLTCSTMIVRNYICMQERKQESQTPWILRTCHFQFYKIASKLRIGILPSLAWKIRLRSSKHCKSSSRSGRQKKSSTRTLSRSRMPMLIWRTNIVSIKETTVWWLLAKPKFCHPADANCYPRWNEMISMARSSESLCVISRQALIYSNVTMVTIPTMQTPLRFKKVFPE